ncbi:FxSxx-COOH system tetratricopeptide repeat protein [Streptomyces sp. NPDC005953]|uniref:FxSxx-COOH system tetratricopeptide repeat protein n=1 Tax=Streptomyces sp. NPDC005953 TaxID=3156719 RepID=UPI003409E363
MSSVEPFANRAPEGDGTATIVTFYSYKGGVGRTMALANVAWLLASDGKRVLVIDWDLESPGLHRFLRPFLSDPDLVRLQGVVEMVRDYGSAVERLVAQELAPPAHDARLNELLDLHTGVAGWVDTVRWSHFPGDGGSISFLGPGCQSEEYSKNVALFDWARFYGQQAGAQFVHTLREQLRNSGYDYVLIDSRTGHSDNASVCTLWLPDVLVGGFNLSNQSIEGTAAVARQVHEQAKRTGREIRILPVPMRIERVDRAKAMARRRYAEQQFAGIVGPLVAGDTTAYWSQVEVRHSATFAYEEVLVPFVLEPGEHSSQLQAYLRIAEEISRGEVNVIRPVPERLRREYANRFEEITPPGPRTARIVHAPRDRQWADWIRTELAGIGISCETTDGDQGPRAPSEQEPTFTIVLVSPALPSAPGYQEVSDQCVRNSARLGGGRASPWMVAVTIEETRLEGPIARLQGPLLQSLGEREARSLLFERFALDGQKEEARSATRNRAEGGARFPGQAPDIWQSPPRNATFLGREEYLDQLRDALVPGRPVLPVALTGPLGVGKSQIALEFVYRFAADYDAIWWINADTPALVRAGLAELGARLQVTTSTSPGAVTAALRVLREGTTSGHRRLLLVLDDAPGATELEGLVPGGGSAHVLITSQSDEWAAVGTRIPVAMPTRAEAHAQLARHFPGLTAEMAAEILNVSGRLPQSVELAATWLRNTGLPLAEAVDLYRSRSADEPAPPSVEDYPQAARTTWAMQLNALRTENPAAERILRLLAYLSPRGASIELMRSPAALAWLGRQGQAPLTSVTFGTAFRTLSARALARTDHASERIVGDPMGLVLLRAHLSQDERTETLTAVHHILAAFSPQDDETDEERFEPVLAELDQHVDTSQAVTSDDPEVRRWLVNQVRSRRLTGQLGAALDLAQQLNDRWSATLPPREPLLLRLQVEWGNVHRDAGRFKESEEVNRTALDALRAALGLDHPFTLRSALGRGAELRALGRVQEAFAEDQSTAELIKDVFGDGHPFTLMAEGNLALSLAMVGMTEEALDLHRETSERCRRMLGIRHRLTWDSAAHLGNRYRESGDYDRSMRHLQYAYKESVDTFGESDPTTLIAARGLAATLRRRGGRDSISAARKLDAETVAGLLIYGGPDHHESVAARLALAADLRLLGKHAEAVELASGCVDQYATWEPGHPFLRIAQVNLALCRRSAGSGTDSLQLSAEGWQGLVESLGADHPLTLIAALNHGNALVFAGESEQAWELDRDTYQRLRERMRAEHPFTVFAATNLQIGEARLHGGRGAQGGVRIELDLDIPYI